MKKICLLLAGLLCLGTPAMYADELGVEIPLVEIVSMNNLPGDVLPMDSPGQSGQTPTHPNDFHAYLAGNTLTITSLAATSSMARVINATNGNQVINTTFGAYTTHQLPIGIYALRISTAAGDLVGQFIVQ